MPNVDVWKAAPLERLVDHIVATHHAYLHRELPLLSQLLTAQTRQHWRAHPEFLAAHTLFHEMKIVLDQHLIQEETAGFPLVRAWGRDHSKSLEPFTRSIDEHIATHARAVDKLAELKQVLWNHEVPADLGGDVSFICQRLDALARDLAEHVRLENDILFPRLRDVSDAV